MSLASYRGRDVVLYFNEGVGCDACFYQMRQFEQNAAQLTKAGITILPIVMNPQDTGACTGGGPEGLEAAQSQAVGHHEHRAERHRGGGDQRVEEPEGR